MATMTKLLTVKEAAEAIGISDGYMRKICIDHNIGQKIGRDRFLTPADLKRIRSLPKSNLGRPRKF